MFLIIGFLLLNACDDHGISTDKVISEDEIIASQELKLRKYYNRLEERKLSLGLYELSRLLLLKFSTTNL